jgi:hypothetical protein
MPRRLRWDFETDIDMGLPPVPDDAPARYKERHAGLVRAFARGHCPECLVDLVVVTESGRPWNMKMDRRAGCPYSPPGMRSLARELGYSEDCENCVPEIEVGQELFRAIEDLEIDPFL